MVNGWNQVFDDSFRAQLARILPGARLEPLDADHPLYSAHKPIPNPADKFLEAALWLRPTHAVAHAQLGWLERRAGNLAAAEVHLRRACELEPHEPRHERALREVLRERGGG